MILSLHLYLFQCEVIAFPCCGATDYFERQSDLGSLDLRTGTKAMLFSAQAEPCH